MSRGTVTGALCSSISILTKLKKGMRRQFDLILVLISYFHLPVATAGIQKSWRSPSSQRESKHSSMFDIRFWIWVLYGHSVWNAASIAEAIEPSFFRAHMNGTPSSVWQAQRRSLQTCSQFPLTETLAFLVWIGMHAVYLSFVTWCYLSSSSCNADQS